MELVEITSPDEIRIGDVIVANYTDRAYTVMVTDADNNDVGQDEPIRWEFKCSPVTETYHQDGKMKLRQLESMTFFHQEDSEVPLSVYAVR